MPFFLYASFPNSRLKVRPPTTDAQNYYETVNNQDNPILVNIAAENPNRTYILVQNTSETVTALYIYANITAIDPTVVATFGNIFDLLYNPTAHILYQKQDTGTNTNWAVTTIDLVGTPVQPLQTASLESPQNIYVAGAQTGAASPIVIAIDVGEG